MKLRKFEDHLHEMLRDPEFAITYLEEAMEDSIEEFLYALRDVACAQEGGLKRVAEHAKLGRESMYKSLSKRGNPRIRTLDSILDAVGMKICVSRTQNDATGAVRASESRNR
jgi:probable addiction module antidote protein